MQQPNRKDKRNPVTQWVGGGRAYRRRLIEPRACAHLRSPKTDGDSFIIYKQRAGTG